MPKCFADAHSIPTRILNMYDCVQNQTWTIVGLIKELIDHNMRGHLKIPQGLLDSNVSQHSHLPRILNHSVI